MADFAPPPVTLEDVARHAGVSKATVSRVVNGNYGVSEPLRQRVMQAVEALGYQPERPIRRLRGTTSEVLGVIVPDIHNPYFASVVRGIDDLACGYQLNVLLCHTGDRPAKQDAYIRVMMTERVVGLILAPSFGITRDPLQQLAQLGTPVVLIDRSVSHLRYDTVIVDNFQGAYQGVTHLIDLGCQRIAFVGGDLQLSPGRERLAGYQQALADHNLTPDPALIQIEHFSAESGRRLTCALLSRPQPPDAIFAASNSLSMGVLKAVREAGVRVPADLAIVGFDDVPWADDLFIPLTTVTQPACEVGREAVRMLLRRHSEPAAPVRTVTLPTALTIRESCGAGRCVKEVRTG